MTLYSNSETDCSSISTMEGALTLSSNRCFNSLSSIDTSTTDPSLLLPSLPSEDEDWLEFGYLLDSKDAINVLPIHQDPRSFRRSQSLPYSSSASQCSSMDVEVHSSPERDSSSSCDDLALDKGEEKCIEDTGCRHLLIPQMMNSADCPNRIRYVNRPWWHHKFFAANPLPEGFKEPEFESQIAVKGGRKQRDESDEPVVTQLCDPRLISLGGGNIDCKEVSLKIEMDHPLHRDRRLGASDTEAKSESEAEGAMRHSQRLQKLQSPQAQQSPQRRKRKSSSGSGRKHASPVSQRSPKRPKKLPAKLQETKSAEKKAGGSLKTEKLCPCGSEFDPKKFYIDCNQCNRWYHGRCARITEKQSQKMVGGWICPDCQNGGGKDDDELYCVCRKPYDQNKFYVGCDGCADWFHPECIGTTQVEVSKVDKFLCPGCHKEAPTPSTSSTASSRSGRGQTRRSSKRYESSSSSSPGPSAAEKRLGRADYPLLWNLLESLSKNRMSRPFVDMRYCKAASIPKPMDLTQIRNKLEAREYTRLKDFVSDVCQIFENARSHNDKGSKVWKCADTLQKNFTENLLALKEEIDHRKDNRTAETSAAGNDNYEVSDSDNMPFA